ncbi:MAG: hypothetical protein Q9199_004068 [Rusavskia elegans]
MIIKALIQDDGCCVVQYATVSREWQIIVGQKIFGRLKLTPSRFASFAKITHRQRTLVKYIWLCIELQVYDCWQMRDFGCNRWHEANINVIGKAIWGLFSILSRWVPSESLVLDISVHSPSDSQHYFKQLQFGSDAIPEANNAQGTVISHVSCHGWVISQQAVPPSQEAIEDAIDRYYWFFQDIEMTGDFWRGLPEFTAVTGLLLRRQTRRRWEPETLRAILGRLPRLQEFYYEPWREWNRLDQQETDEQTQLIFKLLTFRQLKRVVLFEDFNDDYGAVFQVFKEFLDDPDIGPVRTADVALSEALAQASLDFQQLSASFIVDARWFLRAPQPTWVWNQLTSLVLTSRVLVPQESHAVVNDLLQAAATAAMKMPRIKSMELWNGGRGFACVFRYQSSGGIRPAKILWRGNWILPLGHRTVSAWETVAGQHAQCDLRVSKELLDADSINSHGDAIHHLGLLEPVLRPVSLWQIRKEIGA